MCASVKALLLRTMCCCSASVKALLLRSMRCCRPPMEACSAGGKQM